METHLNYDLHGLGYCSYVRVYHDWRDFACRTFPSHGKYKNTRHTETRIDDLRSFGIDFGKIGRGKQIMNQISVFLIFGYFQLIRI